MKKFEALISSEKKELYSGGFGVTVVNGSISGGQVFTIEEDEKTIKIFFQYFGTKIGEEIRFRQTYEMKFDKSDTFSVVECDGCLILIENEESNLLLYPNSLHILEKHFKKKTSS